MAGSDKNCCAERWLSLPSARGVKESELLVTHSMDEKVSRVSMIQNMTVTNAALSGNMG